MSEDRSTFEWDGWCWIVNRGPAPPFFLCDTESRSFLGEVQILTICFLALSNSTQNKSSKVVYNVISMQRKRWFLHLTDLGAGWQQVYMTKCEGERKTGRNEEQAEDEKDATWKVRGVSPVCDFNFSDLPCMHLDPGVNRLGLNITSVHQTDCRPVTPDIVFPICVIL